MTVIDSIAKFFLYNIDKCCTTTQLNLTYKKLLLELPTKIEKKSNFILTVSESEIKNSKINDFLLYYIRARLQMEMIKRSKIYNSWLFVSLYYMGFFSATALTRLMGDSHIYLYESEARRISDAISLHEHSIIEIDKGNYCVTCAGDKVFLKKTKKGAHEQAWDGLKNVFSCLDVPEEENRSFLKLLCAYLDSEVYPPSSIRNKINYRADIGFWELGGKFCFDYLIKTRKNLFIDLYILELLKMTRSRSDYNMLSACFFDFIFSICDYIFKKIDTSNLDHKIKSYIKLSYDKKY